MGPCKFSTLLLSVLVKVVDCAIDIQPEDVTLVSGLPGFLQCSFTQEERARWQDTTNSGNPVPLFVGTVGGSDINRGNSAGPGTKYENFDIDSPLGSLRFNLNITYVKFMEDEGTYSCQPELDSGISAVVSIEVPTDHINISCDSCSGAAEPTCDCTCIAVGGYPENLSLQWDISGGSIVSQQLDPPDGPDNDNQYDFRSTASVSISADNAELSCSVKGYVNQAVIETTFAGVKRLQTLSFPKCELTLTKSSNDVCTVILECSCQGYPSVNACTFYTRNGTQNAVISDTSDSCLINYTILPGSEVTFLCLGSNGINFTEDFSNEETSSCPKSTSTSFPSSPDAKTNDGGTSTFLPSSPDANTNNGDTQPSSPALIAVCFVEGVIIVAMIFGFIVLYTFTKGSRKEDAQSLEIHLNSSASKTNTVYMDLQETQQLSSNHVNVDVPFQNLNLQTPFPGKGLMKYRKALMTLTSTKEEIVVKTVSVPNLLCYQFVNGTKLGEYLRENFQPSKIHQYGNTKQKRYHVPEKGSVESLPRVALQIARGMKYLTTQHFLHPGLRSEKVIIDVSGQCKLYDFVSEDNAKDVIAILWSKSVPYQWMPPEYLFLEKLGPLVDVWSFGVLMWEIFSYGALPHEGKGRNAVEKELRGKEKLPLPNNCPGAIWQITLYCWEQTPEKRPSFDHLSLQLSHMCNDNKEYDEIQSK